MATKQSGTRASSGKKGSKKKNTKKKKGQRTLFDIVRSSDVRASVSLLIGIFVTALALFSGGDGSAWNKVHRFWLTVLGMTGIFLPAAAIVLSISHFLKTDMRKRVLVTVQCGAGLFLLSGIVHVICFAQPDLSFGQTLKYVYDYGMLRSGPEAYFGGELGGVLGGGLYAACGNKGIAVFILLILIVVLVMISFRISVRSVVDKAKGPAGKIRNATDAKAKEVGEHMRENSAQRRARLERRRAELEAEEHRLDAQNRIREKKRKDTQGGGPAVPDPAAPDAEALQNDIFTPAQREILNMIKGTGDGPRPNGGKEPSDKNQPVGAGPFSDYIAQQNAAREEEKPAADSGPVIRAGFPPIIPMTEEPAEEAEVKRTKPVPAEPLTDDEKSSLSDEFLQGMAEPVKEYVFPPLDILALPEKRDKYYDEDELYRNGDKLIEALATFNVSASVSAIVPGPTVTRYELTPAPGVKISKFTNLADDLALCLAAPAGIRIEAPIPNKSAIGVEIPNREKITITFREIIDTPEFRKSESKLFVGLGKNISGDPVYCDIAKMPHLLVAGTTGSGKSVCLNSMIVSIIYRAAPEEVRLILIDPKQVEFGMYNGIPHLLVPVVSDARKASGALAWAVTEMLDRYQTFNECRVRDFKGYKKLCEQDPELEKIPQIVIFIDELADLMIAAPAEVQDSIQRIAQMGRAAGIHLVVATQRPSVDVITGVIKSNMSSRIALTVKSQIDSRTIIDAGGAEKLTGHGDMLYAPVDMQKPLRVQGCYLSDGEILDIVRFLKEDNGEAVYSSDIEDSIIKAIPQGKKKGPDLFGDTSSAGGAIPGISDDDKFAEVMDFILDNPDQVSISSLQRHLRIGFARAGRLIDELTGKGFIQKVDGSKTMKVVITRNQWLELLAMSSGGAPAENAHTGVVTDRNAGDDIFINPDSVSNVTDADMGFSGKC